MSKLFWRAIKALPVIVAGSLVAANPTFAQSLSGNEANVDSTLEQIDRYQDSRGNAPMSQVTNVNQLRDVSPSDWAYEALRSLVDRYGCIVGYPNQTYRGNRALSRYEFAAGLNSCLNQIERLIASSEAILREDIDTINRLVQEFEAELAALGGRIDNLESRTAFLEDHQFSTTTKLKGEVIFAIADTFGDIGDDDPTETTFSDRVRLNFDSSFYGKDRLRTRLSAANVPNFSNFTGSDTTRLGFDGDNGNDVEITDVHYRFPIGDSFRGYIGAVGLDIDDIFDVTNPILESSGTGALSRFSRRDPITMRGAEGTGAGFNFMIGDFATVSGLYLVEASDASNPAQTEIEIEDGVIVSREEDTNGLFDGSFSTGAQIKVEPMESVEVALTYIYEYQEGDDVNLTGSTASVLAKRPFGRVDTRAHQVGLGLTWELAEKFVVSAYGSGSFAREVDTDNDAILYSTGLNLSVLDLGKEGAVLSLAGGIPPRLVKNEGDNEDKDTTYLIEALYKFPVNDNILITPGAYVVLNPNGDSDNETQFVGVLRTTFRF